MPSLRKSLLKSLESPSTLRPDKPGRMVCALWSLASPRTSSKIQLPISHQRLCEKALLVKSMEKNLFQRNVHSKDLTKLFSKNLKEIRRFG